MRQPTLEQRLALREPPATRLVLFQQWQHLLFLHWPVEPDVIQETLPPGLHVDTFEGRAWLGIVPFFMRAVRPAWAPALSWLSDFLELNVRTYVFDSDGRAGVWFYSLECDQPVAVRIARNLFHLPYIDAEMKAAVDCREGWVDYSSRRKPDGEQASFRYRPESPLRAPEPGSFEFFLIERYLLFAFRRRRGELFTGRVHHPPYEISKAEVPEWTVGPARAAGLSSIAGVPSSALYSPGVEVKVHALERRL